MTEPEKVTALDIHMICGWSVHLFRQNDPVFHWQATATKQGEFQQASGTDKAMTFVNLALKCGFDQREAMRAFGL